MNSQRPKLQSTLPASARGERSITLLGATGSIGASTIDLIKREPGRYRVEAPRMACWSGNLWWLLHRVAQ